MNHSLESLEIPWWDIINDSSAVFEELVSTCRIGAGLAFRERTISPALVSRVFDALGYNALITNLVFSDCDIEIGGVLALTEALKENTTIQSLDLEGTRIDSVRWRSLRLSR